MSYDVLAMKSDAKQPVFHSSSRVWEMIWNVAYRTIPDMVENLQAYVTADGSPDVNADFSNLVVFDWGVFSNDCQIVLPADAEQIGNAMIAKMDSEEMRSTVHGIVDATVQYECNNGDVPVDQQEERVATQTNELLGYVREFFEFSAQSGGYRIY